MTPYWQRDGIQLYHGDCLEILPTLSATVDAVATDPPYGLGIAAWDGVDVPRACAAFAPMARHFVAVFGQFPSLPEWFESMRAAGLRYRDHIIWAKRTVTPGGYEGCLQRTHESILVFQVAQGKAPYFECEGPWEDVKLPGYVDGLISVEGVKRYVSHLRAQLRGHTGMLRRGGAGCPELVRKDTIQASRPAHRPTVNYSNLWSFAVPGMARRDGIYEHPTEKPFALTERLVGMCAPPGGTVLDPFMGAGTTGVACVQTGRHFIGIELEERYCEIAARRIEKALAQPRLEFALPEPAPAQLALEVS